MGAVSNSSTVSLMAVANAFNRVVNVQSFQISSGNTSTTVTVPSYATTVTVVFTGGGGGGCDANPPSNSFGGGGGGSSYVRRIVTPGSTIAYNVGAGGTGGTGGGNGSAGGNSNVIISGVTFESGGGSGGTTTGGSGGLPAYNSDNFSDGIFGTGFGSDGEFDGTGGLPGADFYQNILLNVNAGSGGVGVSGGTGNDGEVTFRWGACPIQFDRYTTGTSQTITAPADATFVVIKAWGGGGGGGANHTGAGDDGCGGAGGGFVLKRLPVTGGSTQFTYSVGAGGTASSINGGAGGNTTVSGGVTLDAGGGAGGTALGSSSAGGIAVGGDEESEAGGDGNGNGVPGLPGRYNEFNKVEYDFIHPKFTYLGQSYNDDARSSQPGVGGGGVFDEYGNDFGDPGNAGEIRFEWYGKPKLSSYRANSFGVFVEGPNLVAVTVNGVIGISATANNAAGYNGMIPDTGTIDLLDLRDATQVTIDNQNLKSNATAVVYGEPATAYARATISFANNGILRLSQSAEPANDGETPYYPANKWLLHLNTLTTVQTADEFDVRVTQTSGSGGLGGLANNTWYNVDSLREWYVEANAFAPGPTGGDSDSNTVGVLVEVRRTDTDFVVANATCNLIAQATAFYGEPP